MVSDLHLCGPEDPNQRLFLRFLKEKSSEIDQLFLLGDVFQHWWHKGDEVFSAYQEIVDALVHWKGRLGFIPGNHDFHAPAWFERHLQATVEPVQTPSFGGLRCYLAHGDAVDSSFGYFALSGLLRSRVFASVMDAGWPDRPWKFLGWLAGKPHGRPNPVLLGRQEKLAREILGGGYGLVVFGHTHCPGVHEFAGGTYVNLGDWVRYHSYLVVEEGGVRLGYYGG